MQRIASRGRSQTKVVGVTTDYDHRTEGKANELNILSTLIDKIRKSEKSEEQGKYDMADILYKDK